MDYKKKDLIGTDAMLSLKSLPTHGGMYSPMYFRIIKHSSYTLFYVNHQCLLTNKVKPKEIIDSYHLQFRYK